MTSGTGTCTVKVNRAGDANYNDATEVSHDAAATKIAPTVTFTGAPASAPYLGTFTVASTTNASTSPLYTASGVCSNVSTLYTMTSGTGTCTSTVTWAADSNYNGATRDQTTTATKINQAIAFTSTPPNPFVIGSTYNVTANGGGSGNPVTFGSLTSTICSVIGTTVSSVAVGQCQVAANQAGNDNYNAAPQQLQQFGTHYNFTGFFRPIDNVETGILNRIKAGSSVPVKFSLHGNWGLSIFAAGYPRVMTIDCTGFIDPIPDSELTTSTANNGLVYDPTADQYNYVWKTTNNLANSCRQLQIRLIDGTEHIANFQFTK
jgi:hypothetical protein